MVTGAAALMMGYIKNTYPSNQYSEPQDIENLLQFYARDAASGHTYTTTKGWGSLDIGNVMTHISYPKYKVRHFEGLVDNTNATLVASNVSITLAYGYEAAPFPINTILPSKDAISGSPITYTVDVYRLNITATHALDPSENIITTPSQHAWIRNSSSNLFGNYDNSHVLTPEVDVTLSNVTNTTADIEGYTYHFTAASNNASFTSTWVPFDINNDFGTYAYSLHTYDATANSVKVTMKSEVAFEVKPNPTSNELFISSSLPFSQNAVLSISGIDGQILFSKKFDGSLNQQNCIVSCGAFPNGMYFAKLQMDNKYEQVKFIVLH